MNHLKLYENFQDFEEMSHDNFFKLLHNVVVSGRIDEKDDETGEITESELLEIKKILNGYVYRISDSSKSKKSILRIHKTSSPLELDLYLKMTPQQKDKYYADEDFLIIKLFDDWFIMADKRDYGNDKYYKCDQIHGLINCLKSINNLNESIFNIFKKKEKKIEEELYKRVEYDEVQTFSESHKEELINKHEFDTLSNLSRDIRKSIIRRINNGEYYGVRFGYKSKYCELTKYEDEWFVLKTVSGRDQFRPQGISRYYICDTIEGAIQAIRFGYSYYGIMEAVSKRVFSRTWLCP